MLPPATPDIDDLPREDESFDLNTHVEVDTVLEVRSGKMKNMDGLTVQSGIDKVPCAEREVKVNNMGIIGDEHDYTFHGGVDKAIHAYFRGHYPLWRAEFPQSAARFVPGGFGENLVFARMNERNVCIGDEVSIGDDGLVLQVSLPRQPCFKLNHRFQLKNFAPLTYKHSRTGWYYRVLRPGTVRVGDEARVTRRPNPKWTIEKIQEYLHRNPTDAAANEELAGIKEFGAECADNFKARVAKQKAREKKALRAGQKETEKWREFKVVEKTVQTPRITSFVFEAVAPSSSNDDEEKLKPGAHVKIRLGNGLVRSYSVVSGTRDRFELGIALDRATSRGGSLYMHDSLKLGHIISVGRFTMAVPMSNMASHRIFVAGGVGVTAFLAAIEKMIRINWSVTLHYAVRSLEEVPFKETLDKFKASGALVLYDRSAGQRLDIKKIVKDVQWNTQLYFCGPKRMMDEALRETRAAGLDEKEVHFEAFEADVSGDPFEAEVVNRKDDASKEPVVVQVGEEETLLEVLQNRFGVDEVPSSCSVGNCGTCKLNVLEGRIDHRGTALTEEDKATAMLSCVSRGIGRIKIEI